jgi:type I restriction enzyme, S subunit
MKKYDSYKDSGVEWMSQIPTNWEKSRIRMVGDLYGGLTGKKGDDFNNEDNPSNKPFIPFTNISNNTYISKDHFQFVNIGEEENQNRVKKNDLFFLMSSESYEDLGKSSILLEDVDELYLNSFCKGYRINKPHVYPLFLNYQLLGSLHKEMISVEGNGFTRINLRQDRLLDIPVFIPPLSEQQQIVSFLDTKTSLIDSLIEKTYRKIELLKEKRTSLINEVVTKGLNPNVEMKDSGVEWIGEIPSHYQMVSIKFLVTTPVSDGPHETPQFIDKGGVPFLSVEGVVGNKIDFEKVRGYISEELHEQYSKKCKPIRNDVLLVKSGSTTGKSTIVETDLEFNIWSPLCVIRSNTKKIKPRFTFQTFQSGYFRLLIENNWSYGTQPNIGMGVIENLRIVVPPLSEQQQIVSYLDEQTQLIDKTISIEEKRIELLKEYRQSLISEVVTGKRKVVE